MGHPSGAHIPLVVAEIVIVAGTARSLQLIGPKGEVIPPSTLPMPPHTPGCKIVYTGVFEAGTNGCYDKTEILNFLEEHFRSRERGKSDLPSCPSRELKCFPPLHGVFLAACGGALSEFSLKTHQFK